MFDVMIARAGHVAGPAMHGWPFEHELAQLRVRTRTYTYTQVYDVRVRVYYV